MRWAYTRQTEQPGPPRNAGEVSCPGFWAGNRVSHSPLPSQDPLEGKRQGGKKSHCVPILKIPPLLLAPLLNLSAAGFNVSFFSVKIWHSGSVSWSLPWTFTLTLLLIPAFSSLPPLVVTLCPLLFLSSVHGGVYV